MLAEEQIEKIRATLVNQIDNMDISDEEKEKAKNQVYEMPEEELEKFIKQPASASCIFCDITNGALESYKITETPEAMVVLEINPLSEGHSIIIPKKHIPLTKFKKSVYNLLHKMIDKINKKLDPIQVNITSNEVGGHAVFNILPIYGKETGERKKATTEELGQTLRKLGVKKKKERKKVEKIVIKEKSVKKPVEEEKPSEPEIIIEFPRRVP